MRASDGTTSSPAGIAWQIGDHFADRYVLRALLGRGGSASAYRAEDLVSGRSVAIKLLDAPADDDARSAQIAGNFEREYHALEQLAHPRVVQVWDYGVWNDKPYFTLELLDGGDLHGLAPMAWQQVVQVAYDVCSALSLLHSRRLLHRDLTPRNIRRAADGKAKLFDFGLLSPMGPASQLAGTPPFVAPELINRAALDARSDLFSLGATLYFALTGRLCFPARHFSQLSDLWRSSPTPPSKIEPSIPKLVDELVLDLLRIDAAARPKSAAEVMDRLRPLLPEPPSEELSAARSYLSTPQLVGRELIVETFRRQLLRTVRGRGHGFLLVGEDGAGRSRMLDSFLLEAKLIGALALRVDARACAGEPLAAIARLLRELLDTAPALAVHALRIDPTTYAALFSEQEREDGEETGKLAPRTLVAQPGVELGQLQAAFRALLLDVAHLRPLALAVDDFEHLDESSAALLAGVTLDTDQHRIVYAFSVNAATPRDATPAMAVCWLHASPIEVGSLSAERLHVLLESVFGNVPHLQQLSRRLFDLSQGRPRDCMAMAQHLVDRAAIRYSDGVWHLPEELTTELLPARMGEALQRRIAALSSLARRVGLLLACSILDRLSRTQLLRLEGVSALAMESALDELRASQIIAGGPAGYALLDRSLVRWMDAQASEAQREAAHRELSQIFLQGAENAFLVAHHLLRAGHEERGVLHVLEATRDPLTRIQLINDADIQLGSDQAGETCMLVLEAAQRIGRPISELQLLRSILAGMAARGGDPTYYYRSAEAWLRQIKQDSGYEDWRALADVLEPIERVRRALGLAAARHDATPSPERGAAPGEAIKTMVGYVIMSIAVSVRVLDLSLQRSLPELLEPFAPLSPLVEAMLWNARATRLNGEGNRELAREQFVAVLDRMQALANNELTYLDKVRAAIAQTVAEIDASLGIHSEYIDRLADLDRDPNQGVGAHYVQKVVALHRGDWEAAERHRQNAELFGLQSKSRAMFSTLGQELEAHALARDLTGVRQVRSGVAAMAARHRGWRPVMAVADGHFLHLCGDLEGALRSVQALHAWASDERESPWCIQAIALEAELLLELHRPGAAQAVCEPALERCRRESMPYLARSLACVLAQIEAALGYFEPARARANAVVAELAALGVTGLQLGRAYECVARVAIAMRDIDAFTDAAECVAEQYRSRQGSVLGASYQRLREEARQAGLLHDDTLSDGVAALSSRLLAHASTVMSRCSERAERATRALELLCSGESSLRGHLYLLTHSGLVLAASNTGIAAPEPLTDFAHLYFQSETTATQTQLTAADVTLALDELSTKDQWSGANGERYQPALLKTVLNGATWITGVAMLSGGSPELLASSRPLLEILAKHLIESGDFMAEQAV